MHTHKSLLEIHEDVPADHYDKGMKLNLFQKFWHWRRFSEVSKVVTPVKGAVLDIGCHSGNFTQVILAKVGSQQIYGVDISKIAIDLIQKRIPQGNFYNTDASVLPFKNNFFEAVFCLEMLEHVDDPAAVLNEAKRVMKKGAYGVILVPTDNNLFKAVWALWTMYYPLWKHAHVQSFRGSQVEKYLKKNGFKIIKIKEFNAGMLKLVVFTKK